MGGVKKTSRCSEKYQSPERVILLVSVARGRAIVILQCRPGIEADFGQRQVQNGSGDFQRGCHALHRGVFAKDSPHSMPR